MGRGCPAEQRGGAKNFRGARRKRAAEHALRFQNPFFSAGRPENAPAGQSVYAFFSSRAPSSLPTSAAKRALRDLFSPGNPRMTAR